MSLKRSKIIQLSTIFLAEFFGTTILVFVACFASVDNFENYTPTHVTMSVCSGLAPMIAINIFAHISGAHVNPAVTVCGFLYKIIDIKAAVIYVLGQLFGSVFGYLIVRASVGVNSLSNPDNFCMHFPNVTTDKAFIIEFVATFILILVICSVFDPRNEKNQDSTSLRVGFTAITLLFISGPFTGGSINPARSFGPAFYNWNWKNHWIYWIGPILGAIAATAIYKFIFASREFHETRENEIEEEFFGTAILVFIACLASVDDFKSYTPTHVTMSVCSGLAPMIVINIFGHISGAHINIAVTLSAFICRLINFPMAVVYAIGQILGSVFGYAIMRYSIITNYLSNPDSFCMHLPTVSSDKAVIVEIVTTFVLIMVICGIWDKRNIHNQDSTSLRVGFSVLILTFIGGPFTGGSLNPVRSFAPAFYNWNWENHWIYWVGPITGAVIASVLYKFGFSKSEIDETNESEIVESGNEEEQLKRERRIEC